MATEEIKTAEAGEKPKRGRDKRERREGGESREKSPYIERVVFINRVAKVVSWSSFLLHRTRCAR